MKWNRASIIYSAVLVLALAIFTFCLEQGYTIPGFNSTVSYNSGNHTTNGFTHK